MSPLLDTTLVLLAIVFASGYLIWRKVRSLRHSSRDWSSGHSEVCSSCPVIKINEARKQRASKE